MKSYGAGTVFKRGNIWYAQVWVDGQRYRESSESTKKSDALLLRDKLLGKKARGELVPTTKGDTINRHIDSFMRHVESELDAGTKRMYRAAFAHIKPHFGHLKPGKLTTDMLRAYRGKRETETVQKYTRSTKSSFDTGKSVAPATINRELGALRSALNHVQKTDSSIRFYMPHFPMPKENNTRKGFLRDEKFDQMCRSLPYPGVRALSASSFYTGVRKGELLSANWDDVDFKTGVMVLYDTKNGDPRAVPILKGLMEDSLKEAKAERDELWGGCEAVFAYEGKRLKDPKRSWNTARKKIGKEGLLFHDMRRSANRNMRNDGLPQTMRMAVMGHKTASMDRRYGIVDLADIKLAKGVMEKRTGARKKSKVSKTAPNTAPVLVTQNAK